MNGENCFHANQTIARYIRSLIPKDKLELVFRDFIEYDLLQGDFETFIFNFLSNIPDTKKTPLNCLLEMIHLSDGSQSTKRFNYHSLTYIPLLLLFPQFFGHETYTQSIALNDFYQYLSSHKTNNSEFFQKFIDYLINYDDELKIFVDYIANQIIYDFNHHSITESSTYLIILSNLLSSPSYRRHFCSSPHFNLTMYSLFQKSVIENDQLTRQFFATDSNSFDQQKKEVLNNVISSYHQQLSNILFTILQSESHEQGLEFIKFAINELPQYTVNNEFQMLGYNFEKVLIKIILKRDSSASFQPFSPYMSNSLIMIGPKETLAVPGEESWSNSYNQNSAEASRIIFGDNIKDIEKDKADWELLRAKISSQPSSVFSLLFFAAIQFMAYGTVEFLKTQRHYNILLSNLISKEKKKAVKKRIIQIEILLQLRKVRDDFYEFSDRILTFLQKTAQYDFHNKTLPARPPIAYQRLPEMVLDYPISAILHYGDSFAATQLSKLVTQISSLFMCSKFVRNPSICHNILKFFLEIANSDDKNISILIETETVIVQVFPTVFDFYNRVEKTGSSSEYYDKMNMRRPCIYLLTKWLEREMCRNYYINHYRDETDITFLACLTSDFANHVHRCNDAHDQLFGPKTKNSNPDPNDDDYMDPFFDELEEEFAYVEIHYKLIELIASFIPQAFNYKVISKHLAPTIFKVFYISCISADSKDTVESTIFFKCHDGSKYDPYFLILSAVKLVHFLGGQSNIIEDLTNEFKSYSLVSKSKVELIFDFLLSLVNKMDANLLVSLTTLISNISPQLQNETTDNLNVPESLLDPITYDILEDPQLLPTGTIISKSSLDSLICQKYFKDPHTNVEFDPSKVRPAVEKQKEIEAFLKKSERT